jgi:molybdate transport system substrate-binding protein
MHITVRKTCFAALTVFALSQPAAADEVKLISVGGVKGALDLIIADYTKETGHTVKYAVGSPLIVSQKLAAGEAVDVVVQSAPAMNDYAKLDGLKAETRAPVARGGIGMAVRQGAAVPDISTPDAFKKALLTATSIGVGDTAMPNGSGIVIQSILGKSGIMDEIKSKLKVVGLDPGQEMISKGEIELGLMNISEVRSFVKYAGPVPAPMQQYTNYEAAVTAKATASGPALALVKKLSSASSADRWTTAGLEPQAPK